MRREIGKIIDQEEKHFRDEDIEVFWKSKVWVGKVVMRDLSERFVMEKNRVYGEDSWVILFCKNLSAHVDQKMNTIFGYGKVLLFYSPLNMKNFIQPIDKGLGRSDRILIGHLLDAWLMKACHIDK